MRSYNNLLLLFTLSVFMIPCLTLNQAIAQPLEFKFPIEVRCVNFRADTLWVGVHGDGPGGTILDNTYGPDIDEAYGEYGLWREQLYPPDPPTVDFNSKFVNIPNRSELGIGIKPYDFRGYNGCCQFDTFAIRVYGDSVANGPITISWPEDIYRYANYYCLLKKSGPNYLVIVADMTATTSYTDPNLACAYQLNFLLIKNTFTDVQNEEFLLPAKFNLSQNYPNPFNPTTTIEFQIPPSPFFEKGERGGFVSLKIYDILGREVAILVNESKPAGSYNVKWNAEGMVSGMYFYQLKTGDFVSTRKMLLLK